MNVFLRLFCDDVLDDDASIDEDEDGNIISDPVFNHWLILTCSSNVDRLIKNVGSNNEICEINIDKGFPYSLRILSLFNENLFKLDSNYVHRTTWK